MQPAQHTLGGFAVIVLDEIQIQPGRLERARIIAFVKEAAFVAEHARFDDDGAGDGGLDDVHAIAPLPPSRPIR